MGVNGQYGVGTNPMMPPIETNNLIVNPTGPEWQFLVGEGTYVLKEDILLSTPPPHPSELAVPNPNPLATNPQPETAGTKISLLNTGFTSTPALFSTTSQFPSNGASSSILEHPNEGRYSEGGLSSDGGCASTTSDTPASVTLASAPAFGEGNSLLTQAPLKDVNKRKKPKNNMSKSNSSFISRVIVNDTLTRKLVDRPADGLFAFANINRAFQWLDLSSPVKQDYLTKILFTKATCLCHNVNLKTKSPSHTDVIMGFSTGEIIWWEPFSQRYTRLNKNGIINNTPVSDIKWIPGSECLFLAAHLDGSLVVYDKEKDDVHFNPEEEASNPNDSEAGDSTSRKTNEIKFQIRKSVHSKNQKTNPVAVWKLSNQRIKGFAFSPDNRHLAVVSEDGTLRTIDYLKEE